MYDVAKDLWRRGLDAPRPRYRHAAARDPAGNVYLVGGRDAEDEIVGEVDMFNGTTAKWQTMDFKVFRSDLGAAFSKGSLIVRAAARVFYFGGSSPAGPEQSRRRRDPGRGSSEATPPPRVVWRGGRAETWPAGPERSR